MVTELRTRVEERRRSGYYPEDLEEDLQEHFRRIVAHRLERGALPDFRPALERARTDVGFDPTRFTLDSRLPGGDAFHRTVGRAVSRQVHGVLEQVETFGRSNLEALGTLGSALEMLSAEVRADVGGLIDAILDQLVVQERALGAQAAALARDDNALAELQRRVAKLEEG